MAKISTYAVDDVPTSDDILIGSDNENVLATKNFRIGDVLALSEDDISFAFAITTGIAQTFILKMKAKWEFEILSVVLQSDDTMENVSIRINGTPVTGLGAIDVTTSITETDATALNTVEVGDIVTLVTSGTDGGATILQGQLNFKRT